VKNKTCKKLFLQKIFLERKKRPEKRKNVDIIQISEEKIIGFNVAENLILSNENCKILAIKVFGEDFFMSEEEIKPQYEVLPEEGIFAIFGKEETTGETVFIKISPEEKTALRFAKILNENKVSVRHARDVLRDILFETFFEK